MSATTVIQNPFQFIHDAFADFERPEEHKKDPFDILLILSGRHDSPTPRDDMWEYFLDYGKNKIDDVLAKNPIGGGIHYFVFPDRWMSPAECQVFIDRLHQNPSKDEIERVYIVTKDPLMAGSSYCTHIRLLTKKRTTQRTVLEGRPASTPARAKKPKKV